MKIETELCAYSVESVLEAIRNGVTRVELCASAAEEGVTPSAATIAVARAVTAGRVELSVMIRPRGGDFCYSDTELEVMKHDIAFARACGADGVVLGILTPEGDVDVARTRQLVEAAAGMECTFHRAFDVAREPMKALEDVIATGCKRILTSGQEASAHRGREMIGKLVEAAAGRIEIMAGAGINPENAAEVASTGTDALHFSALANSTTGHADGEFIGAIVNLLDC